MSDYRQQSIFAGIAESRFLPARHPLRRIRDAADPVLAELAPRLAAAARSPRGGLSPIPPELALRTLLLWVLCGAPSERRMLDDLRYNLMHRWFVGLDPAAGTFGRDAFRTMRRRLVDSGLAGEFLARAFAAARGRAGTGHPYFSVNRDLLELLSGQQFVVRTAAARIR